MQALTIFYRSWRITATDRQSSGERFDGSGERFDCHGQPCFEEALRMAKSKVDRLEGPETWIEGYTDECLK